MSFRKSLNFTVLICALGYLVDIYDLVLFSIVRVASLRGIGVPEDQLLPQGIFLINMQMAGMLVGGVLWGILGDKRGRVSVLFGSILLYSTANILNAFVQDVTTYGVLRFIAGVGLAGELGAAVTLVSEMLPKESRGYGTAIIAGVGVTGGILAGYVAQYFSWQTAYIVGGCMGYLLLISRFKILDSHLFAEMRHESKSRGDLRLLFASSERIMRFIRCILIGMPIWYVIGILVTFSPEFAAAMSVTEPVSAGTGIMCSYFGLSVGDFLNGALSSWLKSRKRIVGYSLIATFLIVCAYFSLHGASANAVYVMCVLLGLGIGYWAIFVTVAAEQFGTNLRSTVATTAPNFVRGAVVPLTLVFQGAKDYIGLLWSGFGVGVICFAAAVWALRGLSESYDKDLDFLET